MTIACKNKCWFCGHELVMEKVKDSRGMKYLLCSECGATDTGNLPVTPQEELIMRGHYGDLSPMSPYAMPFVPKSPC